VLDDQDPFEIPLSQIVAHDAERAGITVAGHDSVTTATGSVFAGEVEKIAKSGAQAVFLAGGTGGGTAALWQQLHSADPGLWLLGSSTMVDPSFTAQLGSAASRTLLSTPLLAPALYPPAAQRVLSEYARRFGGEAGPEALYGYEAMSVVLDAIRRAGSAGGSRQTVIDRLLSVRNRDSVLGRYSMQADGETTLSRYGVDRVLNGLPVFYRAIEVR
jgi:branched-chain amino acid transport system substrate-binding protein